MPRKNLGLTGNFALSGAAAIISKTAVAPIERIKLLIQNQDGLRLGGWKSPTRESSTVLFECTGMKEFSLS